MTLRSAVLGIVVVMAIVMGAPYSIWMVRSSEITWSYFPTSAGFCFVVVLLANALVRWVRPPWALRPAELAIIVIMGLAATGIPTFIVGTLLAIISSPYYGATPEKRLGGQYPSLPARLDRAPRRRRRHALVLRGTAQGASPAVRCLDRAAVLAIEPDPDRVLRLLLLGGDLSPPVGRARAAGFSPDGDAEVVD